MYTLYKIAKPIPCDILGCSHPNAVLIVHTDDGNGNYAVCPECVQNMSDMNDTNADFFAQEPLEGESWPIIAMIYLCWCWCGTSRE